MTDYLVLLGLLGLFFTLAMPKMTWDSHRYAVDVMTREIAVDLQRMRQHSLTNGTADMDGWTLSDISEGDYDSYRKKRTKGLYV